MSGTVDLGKSRLTVNRALTVVDSLLVWLSPRTSRSRRSLSLDPETVAVLRTNRKRQAEERLAAGLASSENNLVFCAERELQHPDRLRLVVTTIF